MTNWRTLLKKLYFLCLFGAILFSVQACQETKDPLQSYYFPISELQDGKIYHYKPIEDSLQTDQFWYLRSEISDDSVQLYGQIYDEAGTLTHVWTERIMESGSVMSGYGFAFKDTSTQSIKIKPVEIISDDVFPFKADKGGIFLFNMKWQDDSGVKQELELIRNRIFKGDTTWIGPKGVEKAIAFRLKERLEVKEEGILGIDMNGFEVYAWHTGLVCYGKRVNRDSMLTYKLVNIYTKEQFQSNFAIELN